MSPWRGNNVLPKICLHFNGICSSSGFSHLQRRKRLHPTDVDDIVVLPQSNYFSCHAYLQVGNSLSLNWSHLYARVQQLNNFFFLAGVEVEFTPAPTSFIFFRIQSLHVYSGFHHHSSTTTSSFFFRIWCLIQSFIKPLPDIWGKGRFFSESYWAYHIEIFFFFLFNHFTPKQGNKAIKMQGVIECERRKRKHY